MRTVLEPAVSHTGISSVWAAAPTPTYNLRLVSAAVQTDHAARAGRPALCSLTPPGQDPNVLPAALLVAAFRQGADDYYTEVRSALHILRCGCSVRSDPGLAICNPGEALPSFVLCSVQ